jgi:hypothetical protein
MTFAIQMIDLPASTILPCAYGLAAAKTKAIDLIQFNLV